MRNFGDDVFEGTAKYYAKYRVGYPQKLFDDIIKTFKLDGTGRLLDLGCGTGEMAIPLASYFDSVLAIDPDNQMLEEAKSKAAVSSISNISWQKGSSRDLPGVKGVFRLAVMGSSFHWMDQKAALDQLYGLIENGGVAIAGGSKPLDFGPSASNKDKAIQDVIKKFLGPQRLAGRHVYTHPEKSFEAYLHESNFHNLQNHRYVISQPQTIDQIIGSLFSTSFASKKVLGKQANNFEKELRKRLNVIAQSGTFNDPLEFSLNTANK